jgi:hypothetical protein
VDVEAIVTPMRMVVRAGLSMIFFEFSCRGARSFRLSTRALTDWRGALSFPIARVPDASDDRRSIDVLETKEFSVSLHSVPHGSDLFVGCHQVGVHEQLEDLRTSKPSRAMSGVCGISSCQQFWRRALSSERPDIRLTISGQEIAGNHGTCEKFKQVLQSSCR